MLNFMLQLLATGGFWREEARQSCTDVPEAVKKIKKKRNTKRVQESFGFGSADCGLIRQTAGRITVVTMAPPGLKGAVFL